MSNKAFQIELWTEFGTGCLFVILRTGARIKMVGVRNFRLDDYLIILMMVNSKDSCFNMPNAYRMQMMWAASCGFGVAVCKSTRLMQCQDKRLSKSSLTPRQLNWDQYQVWPRRKY